MPPEKVDTAIDALPVADAADEDAGAGGCLAGDGAGISDAAAEGRDRDLGVGEGSTADEDGVATLNQAGTAVGNSPGKCRHRYRRVFFGLAANDDGYGGARESAGIADAAGEVRHHNRIAAAQQSAAYGNSRAVRRGDRTAVGNAAAERRYRRRGGRTANESAVKAGRDGAGIADAAEDACVIFDQDSLSLGVDGAAIGDRAADRAVGDGDAGARWRSAAVRGEHAGIGDVAGDVGAVFDEDAGAGGRCIADSGSPCRRFA